MNNGHAHFIGIDIGGTNIQSGVIDQEGKVLSRKSDLTLVSEGQKSVIERLCNFIEWLIGQHPSGTIKGIGIGSAGVIDLENGVITTSPNFPDWQDVPLRDIIFKRFHIPTVLDNDANAVVFGEYWVGAGKDASSLIGLTLGTGVGGGIIIDHSLWHGCEGMAGEIGHMTIIPDGLKCSCGNYGCLEAYASATAIVKRTINSISEISNPSLLQLAGVKMPAELTSAKIHTAALNGDEYAKDVFGETGKYLGLALGSLINIFNPEKIIIGGGVINAWELFAPSMMAEIKKRAFARPAERVKIMPAQLGDDAGFIGAGGLVARSLGF